MQFTASATDSNPSFFPGYDGHLRAQAAELILGTKIKIIDLGFAKYHTINFGPFLVFNDSFEFLSYSLEQVFMELAKSGVERYTHLKRKFGDWNHQKFQLLVTKGVYPYE